MRNDVPETELEKAVDWLLRKAALAFLLATGAWIAWGLYDALQ